MTDQSEDEKRLAEIAARFNAEDDMSFVDSDFVFAMASEGLKWRRAAAQHDEVKAAFRAHESAWSRSGSAGYDEMESALKAAAAWRAAHGADVEALKARIAELEKEKQGAFDLGFKAAGGTIIPLDHVIARK